MLSILSQSVTVERLVQITIRSNSGVQQPAPFKLDVLHEVGDAFKLSFERSYGRSLSDVYANDAIGVFPGAHEVAPFR